MWSHDIMQHWRPLGVISALSVGRRLETELVATRWAELQKSGQDKLEEYLRNLDIETCEKEGGFELGQFPSTVSEFSC